MRMVGHVAHRHLGRRELHAGFWWGNLKERDYMEDLGVNGV